MQISQDAMFFFWHIVQSVVNIWPRRSNQMHVKDDATDKDNCTKSMNTQRKPITKSKVGKFENNHHFPAAILEKKSKKP